MGGRVEEKGVCGRAVVSPVPGAAILCLQLLSAPATLTDAEIEAAYQQAVALLQGGKPAEALAAFDGVLKGLPAVHSIYPAVVYGAGRAAADVGTGATACRAQQLLTLCRRATRPLHEKAAWRSWRSSSPSLRPARQPGSPASECGLPRSARPRPQNPLHVVRPLAAEDRLDVPRSVDHHGPRQRGLLLAVGRAVHRPQRLGRA